MISDRGRGDEQSWGHGWIEVMSKEGVMGGRVVRELY